MKEQGNAQVLIIQLYWSNTDKMKKVLFVIESLCGGGAERALSNIVTHFPDDWYIDILINDESLIEFAYKGNILSLSRPRKKSLFYFGASIISRTFHLRKIKKSGNYDACISFLDSSNISNVLSGNKYCKTIVSIRSDILSGNVKMADRIISYILIKYLYVYAHKIVSVSKEIRSGLVDLFRIPENKVQAIVNGFDCNWINTNMNILPRNGEKIDEHVFQSKHLIITTGRMCELKGQWHLIRAFSEVIRREPQSILMIVGDGELRDYLTGLVNVYGLGKQIIFVGWTENPFWYTAHADIFVFPSLYEGYPNALAEAVCCGIPCIATDVHSGAREILAPSLDVMGERVNDVSEEEYGILIPVCSGRKYSSVEPLEYGEKKMADALLMLLHSSEKRKHYRKKSLERSRDLDINNVVDQWINLILDG